jgi:hypothetical protein
MRWRKFASGSRLPGISEKRLLRVGRDYVASAFPNPGRVGCPGRTRLEILARQRAVPDQEQVEHLTTCSDCFAEYHAIRTAWRQKTAAIIGTLVAAAVAITVISSFVIFRHRNLASATAPAKRPVEIVRAPIRNVLLDLRPYERSRGESENSGRLSPPLLDRANLLVTVLLPIGSPEGQYVFQLVDSNGAALVATTGNAAIKDYVTTAVAPFDLRAFAAGRFTLTVRKSDQTAAAAYTVEVH